MTDDLKKIKDLVEIVVKKIRGMEAQQSIMAEQVRVVKDQQSVMNDKLDNHTEILESHTAKLDNHTEALISIEDTLKGYGDMYEVNKDKIKNLDKRVTVVENQLGLAPQK